MSGQWLAIVQAASWYTESAPIYRGLTVGEVSEWPKVPFSKSGRAQALVGSNPTLSANVGNVKLEACCAAKL